MLNVIHFHCLIEDIDKSGFSFTFFFKFRTDMVFSIWVQFDILFQVGCFR